MKQRLLHSLLTLSFAMNISFVGYFSYQKYRFFEISPKKKAFKQWQSCCILGNLQLDAQQKKKLHRLRQKMMKKRFLYLKKMKFFRKIIAEALSAKKTNKRFIRRQIETNARLKKLFQLWVAQHFLAIRQLLTPHQQKQFRKILRLHLLGHPFKGSHSCSVNIH